jgi:hypothetical protein
MQALRDSKAVSGIGLAKLLVDDLEIEYKEAFGFIRELKMGDKIHVEEYYAAGPKRLSKKVNKEDIEPTMEKILELITENDGEVYLSVISKEINNFELQKEAMDRLRDLKKVSFITKDEKKGWVVGSFRERKQTQAPSRQAAPTPSRPKRDTTPTPGDGEDLY